MCDEARTQAEGAQEEQGGLKANDLPAAMSLLKDWSIWLVGLQTGALALITFFAGDSGASYFAGEWSQRAIMLAVACFALSTIAATFLLGQLPSIRKRMSRTQEKPPSIELGNDFYQNSAWENPPGSWIRLANLATLQHWLFVAGILFFALALIADVYTSV